MNTIIEKIRAEIERLKEEAYNSISPDEPKYRTHYKVGKKELCEELLSFLSDIEKECEEKPTNQDLEKELARFYLKDLCGSEKDEIPEATLHHNFPIMWDDLRDIARHFAQWQKEKDNKELSEKIAAAYQLGLADKEKKMLKEAVEGKVFMSFAPGCNQRVVSTQDVDLPCETKVKLIIIKED